VQSLYSRRALANPPVRSRPLSFFIDVVAPWRAIGHRMLFKKSLRWRSVAKVAAMLFMVFYLGRNPSDAPESTRDYTGYDFWLTKLNQFNGDYIAAEMVKAFISSSEYRQRFGP